MSLSSPKKVILFRVCSTSIPYPIAIIPGIPVERHFAVGSYWYEPAMRDLLIASHLAMYSGFSAGLVGARPSEPSDNGPVCVGRGRGAPGGGVTFALA